MNALLDFSLGNTAAAFLLAICAWVAGRCCRKPALVSGLWVLVLLKLVTPPVFTFPVDIGPVEFGSASSAAVVGPGTMTGKGRAGPGSSPVLLDGRRSSVLLPRTTSDGRPHWGVDDDSVPVTAAPLSADEGRGRSSTAWPREAFPLPSTTRLADDSRPEAASRATGAVLIPGVAALLCLVWIVGSAGVLLVSVTRIVRFQRLLRSEGASDESLQREVDKLAAEMGVRSPPLLALLPSRLSPLLWPIGRRARILFPQELLGRLEGSGRRSLFLHELAHLRRRDHWVRFLELIVTVVYWWNPIVWWARREIARWEEECCDACVIAQLPGGRRTYATALLSTLEFLSESRPVWPVAASGAVRLQSVRTRLAGILNQQRTGVLTGSSCWLLGVTALFALALGPALTERDGLALEASETVAAESTEESATPETNDRALPDGGGEERERVRMLSSEPTEFSTTPTTIPPTAAMDEDVAAESPEVLPPILSLAYAPDGGTIATSHDDKTVRLHDAETGDVRHVLRGHEDVVSALAFSPDAAILASAGFDNTIKLWETATGVEQATLQGHTNWVFSVAFSPDGQTLASGGYDKTIRFWDLGRYEESGRLEGHTAAVRSLSFSPDGASLASGSSDRTVRVWDVAEKKERRILGRHAASIRAVVFSPDGRILASGGEAGEIKLWDLATGEQRTLPQSQGMVWCLAFSPQGQTLASGDSDGQVRLWNPATVEQEAVLRAHTDIVTALAFAPDTSELISGGRDRTVKRWASLPPPELLRPVVERVLVGHEQPVLSTAFSPDGRYAVSTSDDATARIWDLRTGDELLQLTGHSARVYDAEFSPDGTQIFTVSTDGTLRLWDRKTGRELRQFGEGGDSGYTRSVAFSPDGERVVSGGYGAMTIWETKSGVALARTEGFRAEVADVVFSPDGRSILAADHNQVRECDGRTGAVVRELAGHPGFIDSIEFSPDGGVFATASYDGTIRVWDFETGEMIRELVGHRGPCEDAVFTPDGKSILTGSSDKTVRLWDVATGREIARYPAATHVTNHVSVSPDGRYAVCGGGHYPAKRGYYSGSWLDGGESRVFLLRLPYTDDHYLSDIPPAEVDVSNGLGGEVLVTKVLSPHGLTTDPFPETIPAIAGFALDGSQRSFHGAVAINEAMRPVGSSGAVTFSVHGDGRLLWESRALERPGESQDFALDVTGVRELKLSATTPGNETAHAAWVEPRLSSFPLLSELQGGADRVSEDESSESEM